MRAKCCGAQIATYSEGESGGLQSEFSLGKRNQKQKD
jgi:hypothetical protein